MPWFQKLFSQSQGLDSIIVCFTEQGLSSNSRRSAIPVSSISLVILLIDIIYAIIDPRIRSQYGGKKKRRKVVQDNG